jgi:hypothetical protein
MSLKKSNEPACNNFVEHSWRKGYCISCKKVHESLVVMAEKPTSSTKPSVGDLKGSKFSASGDFTDYLASASPNMDRAKISRLERENLELKTLIKEMQSKSNELAQQFSQQTR